MKRTTTINLAGMVYHIEEDAFQVLKQYVKDIKRVFAKEQGIEEMIADIELRIAELFQERLHKNKEVITLIDVEEVVRIMGSPHQFDEDLSEGAQENFYEDAQKESKQKSAAKQLYRDPDEGMLAGVSAGLGHYFNIDPVIFRVLWIVLVLAGGSGVLIYVIAWIAIPEAKTTAEKLRMRGQSANLDNFKAFADSVKEEAKTGFKRASDSFKNSIKKSNGSFGNFFKALGKIFGLLIFIGGIFALVSIVVYFFADISFLFVNDGVVATDPKTALHLFFQQGIVATWLTFFIVTIPILLLIIAGEMIAFKNKKRSRSFIFILLIVWFVAIAGMSFLGVKTGLDFKSYYKVEEKKIIQEDYNLININLLEDDLLITNAMDYGFDNYLSLEEDEIKLGYAKIDILTAKDSLFYYTIERKSNGSSLKSAKEKSEEIIYQLQQNGNELTIPTRYAFPKESKIRGQKVNLKIYVPLGKKIVLHGNLEDYPLRIQTRTKFSDELLEQSSVWEATAMGLEFKRFLE